MTIRFFFLPPGGKRRMGIVFVLTAVAFLVLSTASATNYRADWLDPRWWVRGSALLLLIAGVVMVVRSTRARKPLPNQRVKLAAPHR